MNHVINLVTRHIEDRIVIKVVKDGKVVTQTDFEISAISLSNGKTVSFVVMSAGSQNIASKPKNYFKFEIDIMFR